MSPTTTRHTRTKDAGIPWLGPVPEHWRTERAKWLFRKQDRRTREKDEVVTCFRDGVVTLRRNRRTRGFTESLTETGYQGVRRGDLVIHAMDAFAGAAGVSDSDGKSTSVYSVCTPRAPNVDVRYYAHCVREMARSNWILALARGIRERSTDFRFGAFAVQDLPLPPLAEQKAIVRFLNYVDRRTRKYIWSKERRVALLEEQKRTVIHQAVTGQIDVRTGQPHPAYKDSGVEWLGPTPEHWDVMPLRRIALSRCDGPFGSGLKSSHYTEHGVRVIRLQNIGNANFRHSDAVFISDRHSRTLGDHSVLPGDLLVAGLGDSNNPAGRACVAPRNLGSAIVKADCFRFRLDEDRSSPRFLALQLTATATAATALLSTGSTRQRINLQSTSSRAVSLPPLREQERVTKHVDIQVAGIQRSQRAAQRKAELAREYRSRLVADVVTGKLDVREAAASLPEVDPPGTEADRDELTDSRATGTRALPLSTTSPSPPAHDDRHL